MGVGAGLTRLVLTAREEKIEHKGHIGESPLEIPSSEHKHTTGPPTNEPGPGKIVVRKSGCFAV